ANSALNVNIGQRSGGYRLIGKVDDVRVYNRALTLSEIQTDMATPVGSTIAQVSSQLASLLDVISRLFLNKNIQLLQLP
ncbi:MAG: hypothetical protein HY005_03615, partial [Candidatus Staskawiczbacteria bacterium]|nr:hypothetical protein [Candidatus Staskawiczbacteria bacterium]